MIALLLSSLALAEDPVVPVEAPADAPLDAEMATAIAQFNAELHWKQGDIPLAGVATLHTGTAFRYLDPIDAAKVLEVAWGNPPGQPVLGMLFPADQGPLDDDAWGVVIEYDDSGHVPDDEASTMDYTKLLAEMQQAVEDANPDRQSAGYGALHLVGWAEPPHYDGATHKIYWAKELSFEGEPSTTLNYDIRALGREGVISMSAIAGSSQLAEIKTSMDTVITLVDFTQGHRYEDFDPNTDQLAAYGLIGLVAGGAIASKTGILKGLLLALLAGKKFVVVGLVAIVGAVKAFFGGKRSDEPPR